MVETMEICLLGQLVDLRTSILVAMVQGLLSRHAPSVKRVNLRVGPIAFDLFR